MKGVILKALQDMVEEKFGRNKWKEILKASDLMEDTDFFVADNVDDNIVIKILESLCKVLNITMKEAGEAFGEYWVCSYAPKTYSAFYFKNKNAKEFLCDMDKVHTWCTNNIDGASPPHFEYRWLDEKTLLMKYISKRNLKDIFIGLVKGVGKYYKENLKVSELAPNEFKIVFEN